MNSLYRLQQADLKTMELEHQLHDLVVDPAAQAALEQTLSKLTEAESSLRQLAKELKIQEADLAEKESQKKHHEKELYSGKVTSPKELTGIQKDIERIAEQKSQLEDTVLGLMDAVDQQTAYVKELKYLLGEQTSALQEVEARYVEERARLQVLVQESRDKRPSFLAGIEADLLKKYETLRLKKEGVVVARAVRGTCSSCGMALPPQSKAKLHDGGAATCQNCGRMLFVEGDAMQGVS